MPREEPYIPRQSRLGRTVPMLGMAARTAGDAMAVSLRKQVGGRDARDRAARNFHERMAVRYAEHFGRSKGVLMKTGQILSLAALAAVFDDAEYQPVYQQALSRLHDDAPPMPYELAAAMVEAELGAAPEVLFAEFEPEPLAAASIGQVHAARLHGGRPVAVKVQYPGVAQAIRSDLANNELLASFFRLSQALVPNGIRLDVPSLAREISDRIGEEVDYRIEAANLTDFAAVYRGHPFIRIPEIVPELCSRRVLTMDLAAGRRWSQAVEADAALKNSWAEAIFRFAFCFGNRARRGLFHGDPHPGNYLFHDDGTVTFLDFGYIKRYTAAQMADVRDQLNATVDGDARATQLAVGRLGIRARGTPEELYAVVRAGFEPLTGSQPFTFTPQVAARALRSWFGLTGPHAAIVRSGSLDPEFLTLFRVHLGLWPVLGALRATGPWEAIRSESDRGGPPATPMGELEAKFWAAKP